MGRFRMGFGRVCAHPIQSKCACRGHLSDLGDLTRDRRPLPERLASFCNRRENALTYI